MNELRRKFIYVYGFDIGKKALDKEHILIHIQNKNIEKVKSILNWCFCGVNRSLPIITNNNSLCVYNKMINFQNYILNNLLNESRR